MKAEQESIKSKIERLVKIMVSDETANVTIEFVALWRMTEREKAELRRVEAETDRIYLQEGVLLPEEVALKRFSDGDFSIDCRSRKELINHETDE